MGEENPRVFLHTGKPCPGCGDPRPLFEMVGQESEPGTRATVYRCRACSGLFVYEEDVSMLQNPSFEGQFVEHASGTWAAPAWEPWWLTEGREPVCGLWEGKVAPAKPEFKPLHRDKFPYRVTDGETAQCWHCGAPHQGGVFQRNVSLVVGASYRFSAWMHAWSSNRHDPHACDGDGIYRFLGVRQGGGDPWGGDVLWTSPADWIALGPTWTKVEIEFVAKEPCATLVVGSWAKWAKRHNDTILDAAELVRLDAPGEPVVGPGLEARIKALEMMFDSVRAGLGRIEDAIGELEAELGEILSAGTKTGDG